MDKIIFSPNDIDITKSPVHKTTGKETFILGAFNPGFTRLPNGNTLILVRVAEALKDPVWNNKIHCIRWENGYHFDAYNINDLDKTDPRKFYLKSTYSKTILLTSISYLLPVELNTNGSKIITIHYDKIIQPTTSYQEYGIEDARITKIEKTYYMTACAVSSERHSTVLYESSDALNWKLRGIIFDHQNKDVVLFPRKINDLYFALTRPVGEVYFNPKNNSLYKSGPSINLAQSPDLLHWKPLDTPFIRLQKDSQTLIRIGGGAQPIEIDEGFIILFHGVISSGISGKYKTFGALLNKKNPSEILKLKNQQSFIESNPKLTTKFKEQMYIQDEVFTSGILEHKESYLIANGEADLCCRIISIPKQKLHDYILS